jgi:hypothetical protein
VRERWSPRSTWLELLAFHFLIAGGALLFTAVVLLVFSWLVAR